MPLASVAALLLLLFVGVRLISSTMEGASHRQQALPIALLIALTLTPHPCRYLYPYLHPLTLALP